MAHMHAEGGQACLRQGLCLWMYAAHFNLRSQQCCATQLVSPLAIDSTADSIRSKSGILTDAAVKHRDAVAGQDALGARELLAARAAGE